ncbi:MAG: VanZ family protein [Burkholderiales bacterium]|nr:VanZ family protein [Burkholderiales bacterium]
MATEQPRFDADGAEPSIPAPLQQPAWLTALARILLFAAVMLVAVAVLLPNTQLAALRVQWRWFSEAINRVEALWPAVDMVHVVMFGGVGVLLALAFPAVRQGRLLLAIAVLAAVSEFVQIWVPGRTASVGEAALDVAAGALGLLLAGAVRGIGQHPH